MINSRSRYVDGNISPQPDGEVVAYRRFPNMPPNPVLYTWLQSDRLDRIAAKHLGNPTLWWKIMDANPIIQSPNDIRPGMQIRIPRRV